MTASFEVMAIASEGSHTTAATIRTLRRSMHDTPATKQRLFQQSRRRLDPEPGEQLASALTLFRRIELRFLRTVGPEQHVAIIAPGDFDELGKLGLIAFAQVNDRKLHPLAFAFVRRAA